MVIKKKKILQDNNKKQKILPKTCAKRSKRKKQSEKKHKANLKHGAQNRAHRKKSPQARKENKPRGLPERQRETALQILDDRKAEQIVAMDVRRRSVVADYVIVATGRSARQLAAIADYLGKAFAELGVRKIRIEGLPQGDWVLIDTGDVIVHLFRPEVRRYYNIEALWNPRMGA